MLDILKTLDLFLLMKINSVWTSDWGDWFFPLITDLHKLEYFFFVAIPAIFFMLWKRYGKHAIALLFFLLLSLGLTDFTATKTTKNIFQRARPATNSSVDFPIKERSPAHGYSFVSNHSANIFCFALFCSYFIGYSQIFYILAFLVGYSRIYNGVHFPSDVLGGALLGTFIAMISIACINRFYLRGHS